jgi:prepilin-type N-terminal cleavage/methylation domain-containing protein
MRSGRKAGFTLIEVLAALVLMGVGLVSVFSALSAIASSEARTRETEKMHRMAMAKFDELRAITDTFSGSDSGDFSDLGEPDYVWELQVDTTGIENLDAITVSVERRGRGGDQAPSATVTGLVFQPPQDTTGGEQ